jgi:peroxiredoxin
MTRFLCSWLLVVSSVLLVQGTAAAQGKAGEEAPDFPPGLFSDGGRYRLSDMRGRVVVLFFYESKCPRCKGAIPERNEMVKAFKDKPVKFIAVGAGDSLPEVQSYALETGLMMSIFADSMSMMEKRYGFTISLQNIYQIRVIAPDGKIVGYDMKKETIEKALSSKVDAKFKGHGFDSRLDPAIDSLEFGQYAMGMKQLVGHRKSSSEAVAESANKIFAIVKEEANQWKAEADKVAEDNPVQAYDLYAKITAAFPGDPLAKSVAEPMKKLAAKKPVVQELAARKAFTHIETQLARLTAPQKKLVVQEIQKSMKKFAGTPTAEKAQALATELGG